MACTSVYWAFVAPLGHSHHLAVLWFVCSSSWKHSVRFFPTSSFLPVFRYTEKMVPWHPCLRLVSNCEQKLSSHTARRLITMEKVKEFEVSCLLCFKYKFWRSQNQVFLNSFPGGGFGDLSLDCDSVAQQVSLGRSRGWTVAVAEVVVGIGEWLAGLKSRSSSPVPRPWLDSCRRNRTSGLQTQMFVLTCYKSVSVRTDTSAYLEVTWHLMDLVFFFHHVDSRDWTQVIGCGKRLYPLSHLTSWLAHCSGDSDSLYKEESKLSSSVR